MFPIDPHILDAEIAFIPGLFQSSHDAGVINRILRESGLQSPFAGVNQDDIYVQGGIRQAGGNLNPPTGTNAKEISKTDGPQNKDDSVLVPWQTP